MFVYLLTYLHTDTRSLNTENKRCVIFYSADKMVQMVRMAVCYGNSLTKQIDAEDRKKTD